MYLTLRKSELVALSSDDSYFIDYIGIFDPATSLLQINKTCFYHQPIS